MTKYTRDDLLKLFSDSYPIPEGVERIKGVFLKDALKPQLISKETLNAGGSKRINKDIKRQPAKVQKPVQDVKQQAQWYYLDPNQTIQGPFQANQLRDWWDKGFFPEDLQISLTKDKQSLRPAKTVFGSKEFIFKFNPAAFPFIMDSLPADADPLQKLVYDFDFDE